MTPDTPNPGDDALDSARGAWVDAAIASSRTRTDARWVEISDRVRTRAMQVTRRSRPVVAQGMTGPVRVSEQVLISYVRAALTGVAGARVEDLTVAADSDDTYTGVTIFISARYGEPLIPIADALRERATQRLRELLGSITPPVTVTTMEVHIDDVHQD